VSQPHDQLNDTGMQLWRIAIEQELLNTKQAKHCHAVCAERSAAGKAVDIGEVMVELGYLTAKQITSVRAEERRRRLRVQGYEILEKVGSGAVGTVYRARQIAMEREVALKILHLELAKRTEVVEKYISEARAVAKLNHPHIVQGIDVGVSGGCHYFAMEFLAGGTFAEMLSEDGVLDEDQALVYLYQVASALDHAWQRKIIHCDLKPGNLMLDSAGRLKVTDLGLAQVGGGAGVESADGKRVVRGTPHYVSPEQIESPGDLDCRADIYSLGCTFYHLLSGNPPFDGKNAKQITLARLKRDPKPLADLCPDLSEGLVALIHRMIVRDRDARLQTPAEIQKAVVALGVDMGSTGDLVGLIQKRRDERQTASQRLARQRPAGAGRARTVRRRRPAPRQRSSTWVIAVVVALAALVLLLIGVKAFGSGPEESRACAGAALDRPHVGETPAPDP